MIRLIKGKNMQKRSPIKKQPGDNRKLLTFSTLMLFLFFCFFNTANAQATSQLGYSLIGTIQSRYFSGAVIGVAKGEQAFYKLGDKLPDGSQIVKVRADTILLKAADGSTSEMYVLHETRVTAALPYSTSDPYAEKVWTPPAERPLSAYEKRRQKRLGSRSSDDE
jgi:Type II secretion system protein C